MSEWFDEYMPADQIPEQSREILRLLEGARDMIFDLEPGQSFRDMEADTEIDPDPEILRIYGLDVEALTKAVLIDAADTLTGNLPPHNAGGGEVAVAMSPEHFLAMLAMTGHSWLLLGLMYGLRLRDGD